MSGTFHGNGPTCASRKRFLVPFSFCALVFASLGARPSDAAQAGVGYTYRTRFNIEYAIAGDAADVAKVELWVTGDGGATWRLEGLDDDLRPPVSFKAGRDGQYGFCIALTDRAGNRSPPQGEPAPGAAPQLTVVVDTRAPKVEVLEPRGGAFGRARGVAVAWRASDEYLADSPVTIDYTTDDGRSWEPVAAGLDAAGVHVWKPPSRHQKRPAKDVRRYRFRVTARDRAGNMKSVTAADDMLLDDEPPVVGATGPKESRGTEVKVAYDARDSGASGIESVRLYVTSDGGRTWTEAAADDDSESPLRWIPERPGDHGLYLVGTDRAGNVGALPSAGTKPQLVCKVSTVGPTVRLLTFNTGGCYRGGAAYEIRWRAHGQGLGETPVTLEYSLDGGGAWTGIARDLPASGVYTWKLPPADAERAMVRVRATSPLGESGKALSRRPFVIDSTPPRAVVRFDPGAQEDLAPTALPERAEADGPEGPAEVAGGDEGPPDEGEAVDDSVDDAVDDAGPVALPVRRPAKVAPESPTPEAVVRAGHHLAAGRTAEAVSLLEEFIAREPRSPEANVLLGEARARETDRLDKSGGLSPQELLRRYDEAASALRAALGADEHSPLKLGNSGRFWLGMCRFHRARVLREKLGRSDESVAEAELAVIEFDRALEIRPNSAEELFNAGTAHYFLGLVGPEGGRRGHLDRTEDLFEKALVPPDGEVSDRVAGSAHYYLADLARRRSNGPKAIEHAREALERFGPGSRFEPQIRELIRRMGGR